MSKVSSEKERKEIRQILMAINQAWTQGRFEDLRRYFHEKIVMVTPNFKTLGEGWDVCVKSYADFMSHAVLHEFRAYEPEVFLWGNTAVAGCSFEIEWEAGGRRNKELGKEVFVFTHQDNRWLAVWRIVLPPSQTQF